MSISILRLLTKNDECYTKFEDAIELVKNIEKYYPDKNIKIWCPFCCNLETKEIDERKNNIPHALNILGYWNIVYTYDDFYSHDKKWVVENHIDLIIDNPPFSNRFKLIEHLKELDIPFILLQGAQQWFSNQKCIWWLANNNHQISLLLPNTRISFNRPNQIDQKTNPAFFSFWVCWKTNLPKGFIRYMKGGE